MNPTPARLGACLLLAGCTAYQPDPLLPEDELRDLLARWEDRAEAPPQRAVPAAEAWFPLAAEVRLTDGLTLAEASSLALFHGPSLAEARTLHGITGAQLLQAGLLPNPELFVGPRLSTEDAGLVLPASLMFAIPLGDRLGAEVERATAEREVAAWRVAEAELELLLSVRLTFLQLEQLRTEVVLWTALRDDAERIVEWAGRLTRAGEVDPITDWLARLERDDAVAEFRRAELAFADARAELQAMVGLLPNAEVDPVIDDTVAALPPTPPPDPRALLRHPRMRAAEADYRRAEAELRHEVEKQYPDFSIGPDLEYDQGDLTLGIGLALPIPIFDTNQGAIAAAVERRRLARERYRAALLELGHDMERARRRRDAATVLQAATAGSLATAGAVEEALRARLEAGQVSFLEVLAARRSIVRARVRAAELRRQEIAAALRLAVEGGHAAGDGEQNETEERR